MYYYLSPSLYVYLFILLWLTVRAPPLCVILVTFYVFLFGKQCMPHWIQPPTHPLLITKPHVQLRTLLIMQHYWLYTVRVCYITHLKMQYNCSNTVLHAVDRGLHGQNVLQSGFHLAPTLSSMAVCLNVFISSDEWQEQHQVCCSNMPMVFISVHSYRCLLLNMLTLMSSCLC